MRGSVAHRLLLVLACAGLFLAYLYYGREEPATALAAAAPAPIPVIVATVQRRDIPHLIRAVGTVTSLASVTVRSQVDGILTAVHFVEGQEVAAGALLARIDDRAIVAVRARARAELARNAAALRAAQLDLERYRGLAGRAAVAAQVLDQQAALVAQLEAGIAANHAAIAAAEVELSHTRIVSPVSGRVGLRLVDPGNLVRADDSGGLVTVTQIAPIAVVFALAQERLAAIQAMLRDTDAQVVTVRERAGGAVLARGRLSLIDNAIDIATGTVRIKAEFDNPDERLWPGQFVAVELATDISRDAAVVDLRAIQRGPERTFVYRVRDGRVEAAAVRVAYEDDALAVIAEGLAAGDVVVVDGHSRLRPGTTVQVVEAASEIPTQDG